MYIIQEIQTNDGVASLLPAVTKTGRNEAESVWHNLMSYAAVSYVHVHTVLMYDEHGNVEMCGHYEHPKE